MKNIFKGLIVIAVALMVTACRGNDDALRETENWGVEELKQLIQDTYDNFDTGFMSETMEITDPEMITHRTGLRNVSQIEHMVTSNALMMTTPYTFMLLKVEDGANIDQLKQEIIDNIDLWWWICVSADVAYVTSFGHIIMIVMAEEDVADGVYNAFGQAVNGTLGTRLTKENDGTPGGGDLFPDIDLDLDPDFDFENDDEGIFVE